MHYMLCLHTLFKLAYKKAKKFERAMKKKSGDSPPFLRKEFSKQSK